MTLISFHMISRRLAFCFFPHSTLCFGTVCVFQYFPLRSTCNSCCPPHSCRKAFFFASTLRQLLALHVSPSIRGVSLSFSSMMSFFAHCCKLATFTCLVGVFCGVFWARIFHSDHAANTHSQDLPAWDGYSKVFVSHKTAPDGPLTGVHDPASH